MIDFLDRLRNDADEEPTHSGYVLVHAEDVFEALNRIEVLMLQKEAAKHFSYASHRKRAEDAEEKLAVVRGVLAEIVSMHPVDSGLRAGDLAREALRFV